MSEPSRTVPEPSRTAQNGSGESYRPEPSPEGGRVGRDGFAMTRGSEKTSTNRPAECLRAALQAGPEKRTVPEPFQNRPGLEPSQRTVPGFRAGQEVKMKPSESERERVKAVLETIAKVQSPELRSALEDAVLATIADHARKRRAS